MTRHPVKHAEGIALRHFRQADRGPSFQGEHQGQAGNSEIPDPGCSKIAAPSKLSEYLEENPAVGRAYSGTRPSWPTGPEAARKARESIRPTPGRGRHAVIKPPDCNEVNPQSHRAHIEGDSAGGSATPRAALLASRPYLPNVEKARLRNRWDE